MIEKTIKGWKVQEQPEGLIFKRVCLWDEVPVNLAAEQLNEYTFKGMIEDNGALLMLFVRNGLCHLMRLSTGEEGNIIIKTLQMHYADFKQIYKGFFDPDKIEQQNTKQIIEGTEVTRE